MPTDFDLCGKAVCGCSHHAEDGVPCPHDLQLALYHEVISVDEYMERMARLHPNEIMFPATEDLKNTWTGEPY